MKIVDGSFASYTAPVILAPLSLFLVSCHSHTGGAPSGVYLQKDTGHVFTSIKFYPSGEVDISDVHAGVLKATYTGEGDRVTVNLGQHSIVLKIISGGCLDGGSVEGEFCSAARSPN